MKAIAKSKRYVLPFMEKQRLQKEAAEAGLKRGLERGLAQGEKKLKAERLVVRSVSWRWLEF